MFKKGNMKYKYTKEVNQMIGLILTLEVLFYLSGVVYHVVLLWKGVPRN